MPRVYLTAKADDDLLGIYAYTAREFGRGQALSYKDGLQSVLDLLAATPEMGREIAEVRIGIRRHEHGKHVIFYQRTENGILVVRILPDRADWREHI